MENFKKLKGINPELATEYAAMDKDTLLNQISAEVLDLLAMKERVSTFMELCSNDLAKVTYSPESIRTIVANRKISDIENWCTETSEGATDAEILQAVKMQAVGLE